MNNPTKMNQSSSEDSTIVEPIIVHSMSIQSNQRLDNDSSHNEMTNSRYFTLASAHSEVPTQSETHLLQRETEFSDETSKTDLRKARLSQGIVINATDLHHDSLSSENEKSDTNVSQMTQKYSSNLYSLRMPFNFNL